MAIDYERLKNRSFTDVHQSYGAKDTILYALGLGIGQDPMDAAQLRHVYEEGLVALPTMAASARPASGSASRTPAWIGRRCCTASRAS